MTRTKYPWNWLENGFRANGSLPRIGDVHVRDVLFTSVSANTASDGLGMEKRNGIGHTAGPVSISPPDGSI
jgi:hypothetical protein